jgi:hypothetical protein
MQRFILAGFATLALTTTLTPIAQAQRIEAINANVAQGSETVAHQLTPAQLVTLAQQGQFGKQAIPGGGSLIVEYKLGRVNAQKLVEAAIQTGQLPAEVAGNASYLNAVDAQLAVVNNIY